MSISGVLAYVAYDMYASLYVHFRRADVLSIRYVGVFVCKCPVCWRILHTICGRLCMSVPDVLAYSAYGMWASLYVSLMCDDVFGRLYVGVFVYAEQLCWCIRQTIYGRLCM